MTKEKPRSEKTRVIVCTVRTCSSNCTESDMLEEWTNPETNCMQGDDHYLNCRLRLDYVRK